MSDLRSSLPNPGMLSAFRVPSKIDLNVFREMEDARDGLEESKGIAMHESAKWAN